MPRVVSPFTGEEEAAPTGRGYLFRLDPKSMRRWREWWQGEQRAVLTFFVIGALTIVVFSLIAYSTVYGNPAVKD